MFFNGFLELSDLAMAKALEHLEEPFEVSALEAVQNLLVELDSG
jgi:hypothetical protein